MSTDRRTFLAACGTASLAVMLGAPPWVRAEQKRKGEIWLDNNENPLGPSPKAIEEMRKWIGRVNQYPDFHSEDLRKAIAEKNKLTPRHVVMGNGSCEVLQQAVFAFLGPGRELITGEPDFFIPGIIAQEVGAKPLPVPVGKDNRLDLKSMAAEVRMNTGLFYLCNPLNPLGSYIPWKALKALVDRLPRSLPILIDEAYHEFMTPADYQSAVQLVRQGRENIIVTRTFSKVYGLAGLRIGYGLAAPKLATLLRRRSTPVGRNLLAQVGALAAYEDQAHMQKSARVMNAARKYMFGEFKRMKVDYIHSEAPYALFKVKKPDEVFKKLKQKKIHIAKPVEVPRFSQYLRLSMGTQAQMKKFIAALEKIK